MPMRALYFTNLLPIAMSRKYFSRIFAMDSISVILLKYFKVLYFMNLVCTTKFLKYKSLENFQLYGIMVGQSGHSVYYISHDPLQIRCVGSPTGLI